MTDEEQAVVGSVEYYRAKYPRATQVGLSAVDRLFLWGAFALQVVGIFALLRWVFCGRGM